MAAVQAGSKDEQRHKVEQQLQRSEGEWTGRGAVTQAGACGWASYSLHCWKSCFLQNYYIHWKTKPTWRLGVLRSLHITSIWDHGTEHECEHWVSLSKGDGDLSEEQQVALEFGSLAHQNERHWWVNLGQARPQDFSSRTSLATAVPLYVCPMPFFSGI